MEIEEYYRLSEGRTFVLSAENPDGRKGGGSRGSDIEKTRPRIMIAPGETAVIADVEGPGMVTDMWVGGCCDYNSVLRIYWDGEEIPSVEAPLCAFFGYAYYDNVRNVDGSFPVLNSALVSVLPCRGMNCYFRMPFRRHCRMTVENRSARETKPIFYTISGVLGPVPDNSLYFHASYRQSLPLTAGKAHVVIDGIEGRGRFLGVTLAVGVNNPNGCWVEGEAKMYVDGDKYPSFNYTGTEDYFGGSFAFGYEPFGCESIGHYQAYSSPYMGMFAVLGDPVADKKVSAYGYQPRFMAYRWHLPDPILFEHDFRMTLLNMGYIDDRPYGRRDDIVSCAYWYQTHPFRPLRPLPANEEIILK